jgi:hypothetical protein
MGAQTNVTISMKLDPEEVGDLTNWLKTEAKGPVVVEVRVSKKTAGYLGEVKFGGSAFKKLSKACWDAMVSVRVPA